MNHNIKEYKICSRCIMDNSADDFISFNEKGECNYCTNALEFAKSNWLPNTKGKQKLDALIAQLKEENKHKPYDCIMGISGGLDSAYLLYLGYQWDLRILCVHIDDGYDTNVSSLNIKRLLDKTGFDYEVVTPDKEQFNALALAYLKAGVPNLAVPQDNLIFSYLYKRMRELKINTFLSGGNFALESILQLGHTHNACDIINIRDIHNKFGTVPIDKLHFLSEFKRAYIHKFMHIKTILPLNLVDYQRESALKELNEFCGFEYYGSKHLENEFTAFLQLYWLPKKFKVDKKKSHLSSMIISNQLTREQALESLKENPLDSVNMDQYIENIIGNFGITHDEFDKIMKQEPHEHSDYKVSNFEKKRHRIKKLLGRA